MADKGSNDDGKDFLFKNNLKGVKPLEQNRVAPYRAPKSTKALQREADDKLVMQELLDESDEMISFHSGDELKFLREGYPPRILKRLRRGDYSIQDQLDLHGLIASEAKQETHYFINECAKDKISAIRIIHGKGLNSPDKKPVIKSLLVGWLKKNQHVIAVCSAPSNDGGTGAVYVLLK
jgi:DNA-nicking Smr family endonuclease